MANTRDIRKRIRAVRNTAKITRAMQLVAASKMKRAQDRAMEARPYEDLLARMLATLNIQEETFTHPYLEARTVRTRGILLISTDRGLAGPLNSNLFREVARLGREEAAFVTIGRKGRQFVSRTQRRLLADFTIGEGTAFRELRPVIEFMIERFRAGEIDTVEVLYARFKNTLIQEPTFFQVLPLTGFRERLAEHYGRHGGRPLLQDEREFKFEPSASRLLTELLDLFVKREVYIRLLDARASEHSARMVAMKAATDNARKLVDSLTLQYNKARQAGITQEILEITAAAASGK